MAATDALPSGRRDTGKLWIVRAGQKDVFFEDFRKYSIVGIGWGLTRNFATLTSASEIKSAFAELYPDLSPQQVAGRCSSISYFLLDLKEGDRFLTPHRSEQAWYLGEIVGKAEHKLEIVPAISITRSVKWISKIGAWWIRENARPVFTRRRTVERLGVGASKSLMNLFESESVSPDAVLTVPAPKQRFEVLGTAMEVAKADVSYLAVPPEGAASQYFTVPVYFATNRAIDRQSDDKGPVFTNTRVDDPQYGSAIVTIPKSHEAGFLEAPPIWNPFVKEDKNKHIVVVRRDLLSLGDFLSAVRWTVGESDDRSAFIYIHGFNTPFDEALRRTAQIAHDLTFQGTPFLFSWPSKRHFYWYSADSETARWAALSLAKFIDTIVEETGVTKCHVIAHSMGNRILIDAMTELATKPNYERIRQVVGQVVMAAADVDRSYFNQIVDRFVGCGQRITLYVSANDRALRISQGVNQIGRLGLGGSDPFVHRSMDTVDASNVKAGFFGHDYYGSTGKVLDDVQKVIVYQMTPEQRKLEKVPLLPLHYWRIILRSA